MNAPSITLPNVRKSNILHPIEHRVSVRECARLFSLPDDFLFTGNLSDMQQRVCNGVPEQLAKSLANAV
ncbi:DNA cytosine methyltransferase [Lysinibacillus sphaericus]|uniref:DNA cytosine methyltransferase n=1 Tax=Lysinibacillus sphaericus TaxID=1421 RepID=UPI003F7B29A6